MGLGNGVEKLGYIAYVHADFILPAIGEELGIRFTLGIVFCFVLILVYGISIAMHAKDTFGRLMAVGLTFIIVTPAMMNIGVCTAVLPNTGLPLPFISYGGTNMFFTLMAVGLLASIHRHTLYVKRSELPVINDKKQNIRIWSGFLLIFLELIDQLGGVFWFDVETVKFHFTVFPNDHRPGSPSGFISRHYLWWAAR